MASASAFAPGAPGRGGTASPRPPAASQVRVIGHHHHDLRPQVAGPLAPEQLQEGVLGAGDEDGQALGGTARASRQPIPSESRQRQEPGADLGLPLVQAGQEELDPDEQPAAGRVGRVLLQVGDVGPVPGQVAADRRADARPVLARHQQPADVLVGPGVQRLERHRAGGVQVDPGGHRRSSCSVATAARVRARAPTRGRTRGGSVAVVVRLVRALDVHADVLGLVLGQLGQLARPARRGGAGRPSRPGAWAARRPASA